MTHPPDDILQEADPADESFAQLLAEWDEQHASGKSTATSAAAGDKPSDDTLHTRLENAQSCLKLLKQLWPPPQSSSRRDSKRSATSGRAYARFGRYEIIRELGRGGHGVVFLAHDPALKRRVALKVPRPEVLSSDELSRRFLREAEAAARLDHPNILPVYEVGSDGPICFTASAYCNGGTLQGWLAERDVPLRPSEAAQIVEELATAIHHAHTRGVLHRDLKPSNIFLVSRDQDASWRSGKRDNGEDSIAPPPRQAGPLLEHWVLKVADFGLAKVAGGDQDSTMNGVIMGTANYMAPEQAAGRPADVGVATDVYSLGVMLYELLTGAPPFLAATWLATLQRIERDDAAWPSKIRASIPADLRTICLTCLEKDPSRRYASAAALAADLRRFLRGEPVSARPQGAFEWTRRLVQRHPALSALSAMALCLAIGFIVQVFRHNRALTGLNAQLAQKITEHEKLTADAQRLQHVAEERAEENRRRSNGANLRLVQQFADAQSPRQMTETLHETFPLAEEQDLREFAWYYWWNRCRRGEFFVLPGHGTTVQDATFSPDGRLIATCSTDATVRVWDAETGRELARLRGLQEEVQEVAFSPDGKLLAAGDQHGTIKVWSTQKWEALKAMAAHAGAIRGLCFASNQKLVSGGNDAAMRVWDVASGDVVDYYRLHNGRQLTALAAAPSKNLLLVGTDKGEIQLRSLGGVSTKLGDLPGHQWELSSLSVSMQGDRVFSCDVKGNLRLWDLASKTTLFKSPQNLYSHSPTAISADGKWLAVVTDDAKVQLLEAATGNVRYERKLDIEWVGGLDFAPGGTAVLVAGSDGRVALWQPFAPRYEQPKGHPPEIWTVAFAKDGRTFVSGSDDGVVVEWDTATGREIRTIGEKQPGTVAAAAYSPDGSLLATTNLEELTDDPENVRLWKLPEGKFLRGMAGHSNKAFSLAFHPSGNVLATGAKEVILWDVKAGLKIDQLNDSLTTNKKVKSIDFSRDGSMLAFASEDKHAYVYDFPALTRRFALPSGDEVWCVAFSPDGKSLAAGNKDGDVTVWNPHTGAKRCSLRGHLNGVHCVVFSHDGKTVATGSDDDTIKLWGPVTGQEFCTLKGHEADIYCLAFSPDDQWLASGSYDGAIRLWHAPRLASLPGRRQPADKEQGEHAPTKP